jgi:hypothetical protein
MAEAMIPVMCSAQRYSEFIARLASHRSLLGESQMVASAGLLPQTRQGWDATNLRWPLSRCRRGSRIVSSLFSIFAEVASARRYVGALDCHRWLTSTAQGRDRLLGCGFDLPWAPTLLQRLGFVRGCGGKLRRCWIGWGHRRFIRHREALRQCSSQSRPGRERFLDELCVVS